MSITAASLDAALKELYSGQTVQNLVYDKSCRPLMSALKKNKDFSGRKMLLPVIWEDVGGLSYSFSQAQTNVAASEIEAFEIDVTRMYTVARIEGEALLRSRHDKGAFLKGLKHLVDSAINRCANKVESMLFRSQSGDIGTISSIASNVITLTNKGDVFNFFVNQELVFAASVSAALRDSGTSATVTAVDRGAGTVTIDATPTGVTTSDVIFNEGDYASSSDTNLVAGLASWLPLSAPSSTAFLGVDRSQDSRLGGLRISGSLSDIEGSIIEAAALLGRESAATPDVCWMSYDVFRRLVNELGAKVERAPGGTGTGGYREIEIYGPKGVIKCRPAAGCPEGLAYLLSMKCWQLVSMGEPVQILKEDGLMISRMASADSYEVRVASWVQLGCDGPGLNVRIGLS